MFTCRSKLLDAICFIHLDCVRTTPGMQLNKPLGVRPSIPPQWKRWNFSTFTERRFGSKNLLAVVHVRWSEICKSHGCCFFNIRIIILYHLHQRINAIWTEKVKMSYIKLKQVLTPLSLLYSIIHFVISQTVRCIMCEDNRIEFYSRCHTITLLGWTGAGMTMRNALRTVLEWRGSNVIELLKKS